MGADTTQPKSFVFRKGCAFRQTHMLSARLHVPIIGPSVECQEETDTDQALAVWARVVQRRKAWFMNRCCGQLNPCCFPYWYGVVGKNAPLPSQKSRKPAGAKTTRDVMYTVLLRRRMQACSTDTHLGRLPSSPARSGARGPEDSHPFQFFLPSVSSATPAFLKRRGFYFVDPFVDGPTYPG